MPNFDVYLSEFSNTIDCLLHETYGMKSQKVARFKNYFQILNIFGEIKQFCPAQFQFIV